MIPILHGTDGSVRIIYKRHATPVADAWTIAHGNSSYSTIRKSEFFGMRIANQSDDLFTYPGRYER